MRRSLLFLLFIVLVDIIGMLYGYYYYREQLGSSPLYLWLFIPDCPLYVMLFTIALLLTAFGFEYKLFNYLAAVGMMKYGAWTVLALLFFGDSFFSGPAWLLSLILLILHIGMFSEGPLLIPRKLNKFHLSAGLFWFLANDYIDYFYGYWNSEGAYTLGTHPILPAAERIPVMMVFTLLLSVVMSIFAYEWSVKKMGWPFRKNVEDALAYFQKSRKSNIGSSRRSR
jgi:uncharacterized membrane protein YpjA